VKILQILGLGTLLFFFVILVQTAIGAAFGATVIRHNAATGLSAMYAGTIYNPYFWLIVVVAYGAAAFWIIKRH